MKRNKDLRLFKYLEIVPKLCVNPVKSQAAQAQDARSYYLFIF